MRGDVLGLILATGAGLCTTIGSLAVYCVRDFKPFPFALCMGLSSGVMAYVSLVEIWQEGYAEITEGLNKLYPASHERNAANAYLYNTLCFFGGWMMATGLEKLLHVMTDKCNLQSHADWPAKDSVAGPETEASHHEAREAALEICGSDAETKYSPKSKSFFQRAWQVIFPPIEPGRMQEVYQAEEKFRKDHQRFLNLGVFTALALGIHNFPEGVATYTSTIANPKLGFGMALAIAVHNVPEGFSVSVPVYFGTGSRWKAVTLSIISGLAEPVGAIIAHFALKSSEGNGIVLGVIFGVVCGIMTNIALKELFVCALRYDPLNRVTCHAFFAGMLIMATSLILFECLA